MRKTIAAIAAATALLALPACAAHGNNHKPAHKTEYSEVYLSGGNYYTPVFDPTFAQIFWYQLMFSPTMQPSFSPTGPSTLDGGSWSRVPTAPIAPVSTGVVVQSQSGTPGTDTEDFEPVTEATANGDQITEQDTTPAEAEAEIAAVETENSVGDTDSGSYDDGGSGDSGGSYDGGGDSGGGGFDGGGGGDAGGF
jgi:uncharacterized membrane protein YgcG